MLILAECNNSILVMKGDYGLGVVKDRFVQIEMEYFIECNFVLLCSLLYGIRSQLWLLIIRYAHNARVLYNERK